ncbi:MAG: MFS transporter [Candidatus Bathyarchaeia archaeon]
MTQVRPRTGLERRLLLGASVSHMLNDLVPQISVALLPALKEEFGLTIFQTGQLISIPFIFGTVALLFGGYLADRVSRLSQSAIALSLIALSSVAVYFTHNWMTLTAILSLILVGNNIFHPAGFSLSSEILETEKKTTALGFFNAGGIMGFALGPLSVGLLLGRISWRAIYLLWAFVIAGDVIYLAALRSRSKEAHVAAEADLRADRPALLSAITYPFTTLMLIIGFEWLGRHMILTFFTSFLVYERSYAIQQASISLSLISLVGVVGGPLGGYIADRFGVLRWFIICIAGLVVCTYLVASSTFSPLLLLATLLFGFFAAGEMATGSSLVSTYMHSGWVGLGYSLYFLAITGMNGLSPMVGAVIAEWRSFSAVMLIAPVFMIAGLILAQGVLNRMHYRQSH